MQRNDGKKRARQRISVASAKTKGRELQQWTAQRISQITGISCGKDEDIESRPGAQTGVDIILRGAAREAFPFGIECKSGEHIGWQAAIRQARDNAKKSRFPFWLVFLKTKRFKSRFVLLEAEIFFAIYDIALGGARAHEFQGTVQEVIDEKMEEICRDDE